MSEENNQAAEQPEKTDFQNYEALPEAEREAAIASTEVAEPAKPAIVKAAEAKPAETAKPAEHEDEDEEVPKGLRKRFRELTTEIRELKAKQTAAAPVVEARPAVAAGPREGEPAEPKFEDFATVPEYLKAMVTFQNEQIATETRRAAAQAAAVTAQREAATKWEAAKEAIREEKDDFDEVALNPRLPITQVMFDVMQEGDNSAELLYHLGQDAKNGGNEAAKIAAMSPAAQARAITRLEAKLFPETEAAEAKKPAAVVSRAPRPPKLVTGAGSGADLGKEPDPKDFKAWNKWKDRQEAAEAAG